ncbi:MAG: HNH endonuclease [Mycobacterium sp.]|nr:HNH endonuclease [Mycobacterium sp.]
MPSRTRRVALLAVIVAATSAVGAPPPAVADPVDATQATLDSLPIKGRAPKTGYSRSQFGDSWSDDVWVAGGRNGCDTRNDVLREQLSDVVIKAGSDGCVVVSGILNDPYTGTTVVFQRGPDTSQEVQIDHIVALSDAWQKGAQQLDDTTRRAFANDPVNLQATLGWVNQQKGAGDAATWLPPNVAYRCEYVTRIVTVKKTYGLWVTQAERDAIARVLASDCG